jgi:ribonuclease HI
VIQPTTFDVGLEAIVDRVVKLGIKSIHFPRIECDASMTWASVRERILGSFSRVPDIAVQLYSSQAFDAAIRSVVIHSDGGFEPNTGIGGYGVVLRMGDTTKDLSAGFQRTNSNRMELMAAIAGLEALTKSCRVRLCTDSRYVVNCVNHGTLFRMRAGKWNERKLQMQNLDLWKRFCEVYLRHEVEMVWIKGHAGLADNEHCDKLAAAAMKSKELAVDLQDVASPKSKQSAKQQTKTQSKTSTKKKKKRKKAKTNQPAAATVAKSAVPKTAVPKTAAARPAATPQGNSTPEPNAVTQPDKSLQQLPLPGLPAAASAAASPAGPKGPKPKKVGDPCRHCNTRLVRRETKKSNPTSKYYYAWYLYCNTCRRLYHVDEAKVYR